MKLTQVLSLLTGFVLLVTVGAGAQEANDAAKHAADLRSQLLAVRSKETDLQERVRRLDEDLKPENIERALAGIRIDPARRVTRAESANRFYA